MTYLIPASYGAGMHTATNPENPKIPALERVPNRLGLTLDLYNGLAR